MCSREIPETGKMIFREKSWHLGTLSGFSTSIKMQSFGADKEIRKGDWKNLICLIGDCVSEYEQFIPLKQETVAVPYIKPAVHIRKRIGDVAEEMKGNCDKSRLSSVITLKQMCQNCGHQLELRRTRKVPMQPFPDSQPLAKEKILQYSSSIPNQKEI